MKHFTDPTSVLQASKTAGESLQLIIILILSLLCSVKHRMSPRFDFAAPGLPTKGKAALYLISGSGSAG